MYFFGNGVQQDYAQSAFWCRKAADQGYIDAQYILGFMYYGGQGVMQDYAQSAVWSRKAADQGHPGAKTILDSLYSKGILPRR